MNKEGFTRKEWSYISLLPPKNGRYIVIDTETTGKKADKNNIIELAAVEILNGKITGNQFHAYLRPRYPMEKDAEAKHKLNSQFYKNCFSDCYTESDKKVYENFLSFVKGSLIFAHNVSFDYQFIHNDLKLWKLRTIPKIRFRCSMMIFSMIFSLRDRKLRNYCSLEKSCEYFGIKSVRENYHTAIFDAFMTARFIIKMFEERENMKKKVDICEVPENLENPELDKDFANIDNEDFNNCNELKENLIVKDAEEESEKEEHEQIIYEEIIGNLSFIKSFMNPENIETCEQGNDEPAEKIEEKYLIKVDEEEIGIDNLYEENIKLTEIKQENDYNDNLCKVSKKKVFSINKIKKTLAIFNKSKLKIKFKVNRALKERRKFIIFKKIKRIIPRRRSLFNIIKSQHQSETQSDKRSNSLDLEEIEELLRLNPL
jgi:DNA polymerase-3 subunit epsilon